MATFFGVDNRGFSNRRQTDWEADLKAAMLGQYGQGINLGPDTYLGQLASIMAERLALVSAAVQDTYAAQDPAAAEGVAIDYRLAVLGLEARLKQRPTVTNPVPDLTDAGLVLPGLVLYGTPGTTIPKGSIIQTASEPTLQFTTDQSATIAAGQNGQQQLIFSQQPTQGSYTLSLSTADGQILSTEALPFGATAQDVQTAIRALADNNGTLLFTDVVLSPSGPQVMRIAFGQATPAKGSPSSGFMPQPKITVLAQGLVANNSLVNLSVTQNVVGQAPQAVTTATCRTTGANLVPAHTLTVLGSGIAGLTGVDNPLDCIPGADTETDNQATARANYALATRGSGTLSGIVARVRGVRGVVSALGFENTTEAALQTLQFSAAPTGSFCLALGGQTTAPIGPAPTAASVQAAINACPGLDTVLVQGSVAYGFTIDYNGAHGGQAQPLVAVVADQSGVRLTARYARPPKSFEIVAQGGSDAEIAQAILDNAPAGIASYGAPILQTTASFTAGSQSAALGSVQGLSPGQNLTGQGLQPGTLIVGITNLTVSLSLAAIASYTGVPVIARTALLVPDAQGNPHLVALSRPTPALLYIACTLVTDFYNTPGAPASGHRGAAAFDPASLPAVQQALIDAATKVPIGGTLLAKGSQGLVGAFNGIAGIVDYDLRFDISPNPTNTQSLQLLPEQILSVQQAFVQVSFT